MEFRRLAPGGMMGTTQVREHVDSRTAWHRARVMCGIVLFALCASMIGARAAVAQEVYGTVRSGTPPRAVAGVLVTVSLARNDSTIARVTTNAGGAYRVQTGSAPVVVRALRIGQQPVELGRITLTTGERRELDAALPDRPVQMIAVTTTRDQQCRRDPVDGSLVAQLFEDARTALWLSRVAARSLSARTVVRRVEQSFDTKEQAVGEPQIREDTIRSLQPFRSAPVDTLLARGFRESLPGAVMIWSAPDAELLTDDRFLSAYCLRLADGSSDHPTEIGVAFEPASERKGVVQVHGVLWLDRRTHDLRRIVYGYRGVEPSVARATPGGVVEYAQVDGGSWFVSDWSLRMPIIAQVSRRVGNRPPVNFVTVHGVQTTSAYVVAMHIDETLRFSAGEGRADVLSAGVVSPLVDLRDSAQCGAPASDTLSTLSGDLRNGAGNPLAGVLVRARWTVTIRTGDEIMDNLEYVAFESEVFTHTGADGRFDLCELPPRVQIEVVAGPADAPIADATLRLRLQATAAHISLQTRAR